MAQPPPDPISLPSPPNDGITSLAYHGQTSLLCSTSWDGALRIHDALAKSPVTTHAMDSGPLLSMAACPPDGDHGKGFVFTGGIDGSVKKFDIATSSTSLIGLHSAHDNVLGDKKVACSCLGFLHGSGAAGLVASAGWDAKFHVWDARVSSFREGAAVTLELPGKAFNMDASSDGTKVVVATSGRRLCFIDIRRPSNENAVEDVDKENSLAKLLLDRESSLKYQTRCVRFFSDATGIAVGSIEGRVAIEYLDDIGIPSGEKRIGVRPSFCHFLFLCR